jgi:hypothetical protein
MTSNITPPPLEWYSLENAADYLHRTTGHSWKIAQVFEHARKNGWPIFAVFPDGLTFLDNQDKPLQLHSDRIFRLNNYPNHMLSLHGKASVRKVILPIEGVGDKELSIVHPTPAPIEITLADIRLRDTDLNSILAPAPISNEVVSACAFSVRTNTTTDKREDALAPIIKMAQQQAPDSNNAASVWAALMEIANSSAPPPPVVGFVVSKGIKFKNDDGKDQYLTKSSVEKRLSRLIKKTASHR